MTALSFSAAANASPLLPWELPGTQLSGSPASDSQIITTSDGSTVIAWLAGGEGGTIATVTRPAGGEFGPTETVPGTGAGVKNLRLASAPDGTVWIGWTENTANNGVMGAARIFQTVAAVSRPPGGSFSVVQNVYDGVAEGQSLRFAFTADSSKVFLAWLDSPVDGSSRLARVALKIGSDPFGGVEAPMPETHFINDFYLNVIQSGVDAGTAVITAQNYDPVVGGERVVAVTRPPSDTSFGARDSVSDTDHESSRLTPPQVAPNGALTVAFGYLTSPARVQTATLEPGNDQFSDPVNASDTATRASRPKLAVGSTGKIAVSYVDSPTIPMPRSQAAVAIKSADASSYVQEYPPGSLTEDENYSGTAVAIGPDNRATLGWTSPYAYYGQGTARVELASSEDANGNFLAPVQISAQGTYANTLTLQFTPDGDLTALWGTAANEIVTASRAANQDPSASFSQPVTLTTNGTLTGLTIASTGRESLIWSDDASTVSFASTEAPQRHVTVTKEGAGSGSVISSPAGIDCGATCSAAFNQGLELTLTATPAAGSTFTGWSFACPPNKAVKSSCRKIVTIPAGSGSNSSPTFTFSVDYDTYLVATFAKAAPAPSNLFTVSADGASTADLLTLVKVPGPGTAAQLGTFSGAASSRSARRVAACRASKKLSKAGSYKLSCKLTSAARSARRKGSIRVSLRTTFTPTGGAARSVTRTVTLKKTSSGVTG